MPSNASVMIFNTKIENASRSSFPTGMVKEK
jgi:hypothetical protein